jgi:hypothetical protein
MRMTYILPKRRMVFSVNKVVEEAFILISELLQEMVKLLVMYKLYHLRANLNFIDLFTASF